MTTKVKCGCILNLNHINDRLYYKQIVHDFFEMCDRPHRALGSNKHSPSLDIHIIKKTI